MLMAQTGHGRRTWLELIRNELHKQKDFDGRYSWNGRGREGLTRWASRRRWTGDTSRRYGQETRLEEDMDKRHGWMGVSVRNGWKSKQPPENAARGEIYRNYRWKGKFTGEMVGEDMDG